MHFFSLFSMLFLSNMLQNGIFIFLRLIYNIKLNKERVCART